MDPELQMTGRNEVCASGTGCERECSYVLPRMLPIIRISSGLPWRIHRRILRIVLGTLMLCCISPSDAGAQESTAASASRPSGIVKLPIVEKQDIRFLPFSANGEAPQSRVLKFTQDGQGFLWLATTTGLYRYDGYSLKHYVHEPDDPASLSGDRVFTVYTDRSGALWIGTQG